MSACAQALSPAHPPALRATRSDTESFDEGIGGREELKSLHDGVEEEGSGMGGGRLDLCVIRVRTHTTPTVLPYINLTVVLNIIGLIIITADSLSFGSGII